MEGCVGGLGTTNGRDRTTTGATPVSWSIWPMEEEEWHSSHPNPPQSLPISSSSSSSSSGSSSSITTNFPSYTNTFSTTPGVVNGGLGVDAHHHLTCLKLGKRQYCEEPLGGNGAKKERGMGSSSSSSSSSSASSSSSSSSSSSTSSSSTNFTAVPRCQVEGCNVGLVEAKEYHKRHKVCETHSKSPKVVVLGLEQRFCQQCSRFHVLSEFDDTKRSCRRRLSGHNERRRKSTNESIMRSPVLDYSIGFGGRFPFLPLTTSPGCALSLLSSESPACWVSPDLSHQSSAALRELIAENRATLFSRQLLSNHGDLGMASLDLLPHHQPYPIPMPVQLPEEWEHLQGDNGAHVTLDLMQVPNSSYNVLPLGLSKTKEDEECCEIWKSLEETHVV